MTTFFPLHRFAEFGGLSTAEAADISTLGEESRSYARNSLVRAEGQPADGFFLLLSGWAIVSCAIPGGGRQIMKIHLPGDAIGTPSMSMAEAAESIWTVTPATIAYVPLPLFGRMMAENPRVAACFLLSVQRERVALMDRLASNGRTSAVGRVAAFIVELFERLEPLKLVTDDAADIPLTQTHIADLLSLTSVHVNRTLRELEHRAIIARAGRHWQILDRAQLAKLAARPVRRLREDLSWLPAPR